MKNSYTPRSGEKDQYLVLARPKASFIRYRDTFSSRFYQVAVVAATTDPERDHHRKPLDIFIYAFSVDVCCYTETHFPLPSREIRSNFLDLSAKSSWVYDVISNFAANSTLLARTILLFRENPSGPGLLIPRVNTQGK